MENGDTLESRQSRRANARRAGSPPPDFTAEEIIAAGYADRSKNPAPTFTKTELWSARMRKQLANTQAAADTIELDLPSLLPVAARRLPMNALFELGTVPNALLPTLQEWFAAFELFPDSEADRTAAIASHLESHFDDYLKIVRFVFLSCVLDPVFVEAEIDGKPEIILESEPDLPPVSELDLIYVFEWAQGVTESAQEWFRKRSEADISTVRTGEEIRPDAGGPDGDIRDA